MGPGWCGGKLRAWLASGWGFVTLGVAVTITSFLLGVVYFSIRAITTSLEHVDIVPTYATALLLCCVGILTMFLYKRRDTLIAVPTMVLTFVCLLLALASFVVLFTKVIRVMRNFRSCQYDDVTRQCHCYTTHADSTMSEMVYKEAPSCSLVERNLLQLAYTQSALFILAFILGVLTATLTAYTMYNERNVDYLLEDEDEYVEQDFETPRTENMADPLIGQYRQLMSRQITLPDFRLSCDHQLQGGFSSNRTLAHGVSCVAHRGTPAAGYRHTTGRNSGPPGYDAIEGALETRPGTARGEFGRTDRRRTGRLSIMSGIQNSTLASLPGVPWDGYCRPPEGDANVQHPTFGGDSNTNGEVSRPVRRSESDGGQWSLRPLLLPVDPVTSPGRSRRSGRRVRDRPRLQSRSRGARRRMERHQPYVAFVPVSYSMYRPSALLGLGVSPFPMEPPPPYSVIDPPPYVSNSPAPPYTSRPTSCTTSRATSPSRQQPCEDRSIYENTPCQTSRENILFQTRV